MLSLQVTLVFSVRGSYTNPYPRSNCLGQQSTCLPCDECHMWLLRPKTLNRFYFIFKLEENILDQVGAKLSRCIV